MYPEIMRPQAETTTVTVRLEPKEHAALVKLAEKEGRSLGSQVRIMILPGLQGE